MPDIFDDVDQVEMTDRTAYDEAIDALDTADLPRDVSMSLITVTVTALRQTKMELTPTVWVDVLLAADYVACCETELCAYRGIWGATGTMPPGHVLVRSSTGHYLAHEPAEA